MIVFTGVACSRWQSSGLLFFALMMFRDVLSAFFLVNRNPSPCAGSRSVTLLAYVSSGLPLIYLGPTGSASVSVLMAASVLSIVGYAVSTFALIELGHSFGVAPANRGRITTGVYRIADHPMYLGYLLAESGLVFANSANVSIFVFSSVLYLFRARAERRVVFITGL